MTNREMHHIALITNSKSKKLHFDNKPEFIEWLKQNEKYFDEYIDAITIYYESEEERKEITKALTKLRK